MPASIGPRYPIYVPSKGRAARNLTAQFLLRDAVPFHLVVEPQEQAAYAARFGAERLLVLPFQDQGSVIPARNWIKAHATAAGFTRHWQLDDNMRYITRRWKGYRLRCNAGSALAVVEDFADRYENIAVAGLAYDFFVPDSRRIAPFFLNVHVYSCTLTLNALPYAWRGRYNEDTDYCLQALAGGWCTAYESPENALRLIISFENAEDRAACLNRLGLTWRNLVPHHMGLGIAME